MTPFGIWRKSSYSGEGDGNDCVEIAHAPAYVAIRDSKDPTHGALTFPFPAFTAFVEALKEPSKESKGR
ncbi:DUF397 domain-containing protein [Streptomyces leeuwenhoekii]|uniref:DUF397 domain-containing protein n=1 Tax=Streptomyces leeuwenhoekii TaxID=1437453 RepID=A0A0F7VZD7_STRLW|nr:DUF397 domain-containing protein [Streptomyces leeuwenhoekii]CQR63963.1 Hypothetical Protein sle_45050 [Streptomyces leeuwenhoekii]